MFFIGFIDSRDIAVHIFGKSINASEIHKCIRNP